MNHKAEECLKLLAEKAAELERLGERRYPKRSDFSEAEVSAIKSFFGPWPRALEAAGVKPPRSTERIERTREKRIRAKRRRIRARKQKQKTEETENEEKDDQQT